MSSNESSTSPTSENKPPRFRLLKKFAFAAIAFYVIKGILVTGVLLWLLFF